ncbi:MAG TPA: hypothetical protein VM198_15370 [Longimicrobiales bacterium]|nr:hypothetical protein [Longimicrobiales bacterium]
MSARSTVLATAVILVSSACDAPLFDSNCSVDRIVARFDGAFTLRGTEQQLGREDAVTATNLAPPVFRQLNDVLLEGSASAGGAVWSHGGIGSANDFFALAVGTPLQDGQVRTDISAFQGGGWGPQALAPGSAAFALRVDGLWATEVGGEVTVVDAAPLMLEVELAFTLSDGVAGSLSGTDVFRYERGTCVDARG